MFTVSPRERMRSKAWTSTRPGLLAKRRPGRSARADARCARHRAVKQLVYGEGGLGDWRGAALEREAYRSRVHAELEFGSQVISGKVELAGRAIVSFDRCAGRRRDQQDHIVVITVIVESRDPGRMGRARERRRCQDRQCRDQYRDGQAIEGAP